MAYTLGWFLAFGQGRKACPLAVVKREELGTVLDYLWEDELKNFKESPERNAKGPCLSLRRQALGDASTAVRAGARSISVLHRSAAVKRGRTKLVDRKDITLGWSGTWPGHPTFLRGSGRIVCRSRQRRTRAGGSAIWGAEFIEKLRIP